jgi:phage shock protein E
VRVLFIALGLALSAGCGGASTEVTTVAQDVRPAPRISGRDARQLVASGAVLLDVRSDFEFTLRHLEGARHIPLAELPSRADELDPAHPVVVYCLSGHRSVEAGRILRERGFRYVFDLGALTAY